MKCICFYIPEKKMLSETIESIDSFLNRRFVVGNIYDYETRIDSRGVLPETFITYLVEYKSKTGIENIVYSEEKFNKIFKTLSDYRNLKLQEILS